MAVQFTAQDETGEVVGANTYSTVAQFQQYCENRGYSLGTLTTDQLKTALIRGMDYLESRYRFPGTKLTDDPTVQTTEWPRAFLTPVWPVTYGGYPGGVGWADLGTSNTPAWLVDIPQALKDAQMELAYIATSRSLTNDSAEPTDGLLVTEISETVDVISSTKKYALPEQSSSAQYPTFPKVDMILIRGRLIEPTNRVMR